MSTQEFINLSDSVDHASEFASRHIGPRLADQDKMLQTLGFESLNDLLESTIPPSIRTQNRLKLPKSRTEHETVSDLRQTMEQNQIAKTFIGLGYHPSLTPPVIQRGVLENPGWYTQYTPYQAEIAQGRLETLFYFQTMVCELTGMEVANASLLDEGTAAAEAMALAYGAKGGKKKQQMLLIGDCHPQTVAVLQTRAEAIGIDITSGNLEAIESGDAFAVFVQYPESQGAVRGLAPIVEKAHEFGALVIVAADLLPLTLLKPPGEFGADIVIGSSQAFGIPLGYGGPHAAFFATRDRYKRKLPGRVVGVSKDSQGKRAFRLALQTREQHIRREKATSNICTAQALLANMAALYSIYHGPDGLKKIASDIHRKASWLADALLQSGHTLKHKEFFDTLTVEVSDSDKKAVLEQSALLNLRFRTDGTNQIGISINETTSENDLRTILKAFNVSDETQQDVLDLTPTGLIESRVPKALHRSTDFMGDPVFHSFRSETELMRFIKRLESKDLSLTSSMIPLGSCTMKLNAAMEMQALSWPEVANLHPFCPPEDAKGYHQLILELEEWLANITGFDAVSLQPNAGSQGEFAGLLAIRGYLDAKDQAHRTVCLIPRSAHGTNPASAVMAGFKVVPVDCDDQGNIDVANLNSLAAKHSDDLGALMITYPSTHGVFEESINEITATIHEHGGQVYLDGANLNAQVGLCTPGEIGADVCHLNLHKTFCIPHGGGGPGVGPIATKSHLAPFLPGHPANESLAKNKVGPVAAAPYGSASILTISWAYIAAMGTPGLSSATAVAILNANYIAKRLESAYPVLYKGTAGLVAHECIIDLRRFKKVTVEDVAKRLMDYGFHAPTISWPVAGTMMIEPTESESLAELDRFCDAMLSIHKEIEEVESEAVSQEDNLLKNAPHTASMISATDWNHPYTREQAAFPLEYLHEHKFWPAVGRIDNVFGDRNPICTCQGMEEFNQD